MTLVGSSALDENETLYNIAIVIIVEFHFARVRVNGRVEGPKEKL